MTKQDAIDKIRKLLKREGRFEAEHDTAQILAAALAEKYDLNIDEIGQTDPQSHPQIEERSVGEWVVMPDEAKFASIICRRFFEVNALQLSEWCQARMIFAGLPHHLEIAEHVFQFCVAEFRRAWNRRTSKTKMRKKFIYGVYLGLHTKLNALEQARIARASAVPNGAKPLSLQISWEAKRDQYMQQHYPGSESRKIAPSGSRSVATRNGFMAGRNIDIHPAIKAGPPEKQLLLLPDSSKGQLQ